MVKIREQRTGVTKVLRKLIKNLKALCCGRKILKQRNAQYSHEDELVNVPSSSTIDQQITKQNEETLASQGNTKVDNNELLNEITITNIDSNSDNTNNAMNVIKVGEVN